MGQLLLVQHTRLAHTLVVFAMATKLHDFPVLQVLLLQAFRLSTGLSHSLLLESLCVCVLGLWLSSPTRTQAGA